MDGGAAEGETDDGEVGSFAVGNPLDAPRGVGGVICCGQSTRNDRESRKQGYYSVYPTHF